MKINIEITIDIADEDIEKQSEILSKTLEILRQTSEPSKAEKEKAD